MIIKIETAPHGALGYSVFPTHWPHIPESQVFGSWGQLPVRDRGNGPETRPRAKPLKRGCSPNLPALEGETFICNKFCYIYYFWVVGNIAQS
jgi:hypothetical protein